MKMKDLVFQSFPPRLLQVVEMEGIVHDISQRQSKT